MTYQYLVPMIENVNQRDTKWICVCPNCQNERIISYAQKWNIETNKSYKECRNCQVEIGLLKYNKTGLKIGRSKENQKKAANSRIGTKRLKNLDMLKYRQLFAPETLSNPQMKEKQRLAKLGKYGPLASRWEGGKTQERKLICNRDEYKQLRKSVFQRDNFTCKICNKTGGYLEMDHIKEWCNYPELRFEIANCRTLCKECHKMTDNYGSKAKKKSGK